MKKYFLLITLVLALAFGDARASFAQQSSGGTAPASGGVQTEPPPNVAAPQQGAVNSQHHASDYRGYPTETQPNAR
jgi:hypothetical protein